ncbi:lysylphosphatidylglycerol synthase transmembrane domain-containing protein [Celeribacter indicus]|uniref:lysylphosphatidylglycerol synthase transmembrane domain-containing protein n=1 Tax=Celeribacter indicus TaxID=1208324 RepID=UPI0008998242|nr:lysylphosphatidylglycerol synthase transmembrane domain-containing protein [Celeribacter indicus]SDX01908.1 hypothetical protein SAMN05443573_111101 [Celeribacter indicus]
MPQDRNRAQGLRNGALWLLSAVGFIAFSIFGLSLASRFFGGEIPALDPRLFELSSLAWIGLFLLIYFLADGLRLYYVLLSLGAQVRFREVFPLVFVNILFSNVTPLATGGGFAQVWYLQRRGVAVGTSAAATLIRTILAMLVIFTAAPLFQLLRPSRAGAGLVDMVIQSLSAFIALYLIGFLIVLLRPQWLGSVIDGLVGLLARVRLLNLRRRVRWGRAIRREVTEFSEGFGRFRRGPLRYSLGSAVFTVIFLLTLFAFPALLMSLLGYEVDWIRVIGTLSIVTFLMYFAPTPGGAGFSELAFAALMSGQIDSPHLLLVILAWRFLTIYLGMALGLVVSIFALRQPKAAT